MPLRAADSVDKLNALADSPTVAGFEVRKQAPANRSDSRKGGETRSASSPADVSHPVPSRFLRTVNSSFGPRRRSESDLYTTLDMATEFHPAVEMSALADATESDRDLAQTLRSLFPAPAGLNAAGLAHWEQALTQMLNTRVREFKDAGITSKMALTVARIIASHGHRSGVPGTLSGLAAGPSAYAAAQAAQFFAAPAGVIAGVAAVAGSLGVGAAQTAWDQAIEHVYLKRLSSNSEHPTARLLGELKRSDDRAGLAASAITAFRNDVRQYVNLDGMGFGQSVLALANHLIPVLGPQGQPSTASLAHNREAQRLLSTAPVEVIQSTLKSGAYQPQRYAADGTPLMISRADVRTTLQDNEFLKALASRSNLGRLLAAPAVLAFQGATNATKAVRTVVKDITQHVFDPSASAIVPTATGATIV